MNLEAVLRDIPEILNAAYAVLGIVVGFLARNRPGRSKHPQKEPTNEYIAQTHDHEDPAKGNPE